MDRRKIRLALGLLILLISLAILLWGIWPIMPEVRTVPVSPNDMQLPLPDSFVPLWLGITSV